MKKIFIAIFMLASLCQPNASAAGPFDDAAPRIVELSDDADVTGLSVAHGVPEGSQANQMHGNHFDSNAPLYKKPIFRSMQLAAGFALIAVLFMDVCAGSDIFKTLIGCFNTGYKPGYGPGYSHCQPGGKGFVIR
jgi:hypothetical protein